MKRFHAICLLVVVASVVSIQALEISDSMKKQARKLHNLCLKETGVTEEMLQRTISSGELPTEREFQCYAHCLFDKVGLVDSQNVVFLEHLVDVLPEKLHATVLNLVASCGTQPGADGCETVYLTVKCYLGVHPELLMSVFSFMFN